MGPVSELAFLANRSEKWLSQFEAREIENLDAFETRFGFGVPAMGAKVGVSREGEPVEGSSPP